MPAIWHDDFGFANWDGTRFACHFKSDDNTLILTLYGEISPDFRHVLGLKKA
jgi:hypothetical protein